MSAINIIHTGNEKPSITIDGIEISDVRSFSYKASINELPVLIVEVNGSFDDVIRLNNKLTHSNIFQSYTNN